MLGAAVGVYVVDIGCDLPTNGNVYAARDGVHFDAPDDFHFGRAVGNGNLFVYRNSQWYLALYGGSNSYYQGGGETEIVTHYKAAPSPSGNPVTFIGIIGPGGTLEWTRQAGPMKLLAFTPGLVIGRKLVTTSPGDSVSLKLGLSLSGVEINQEK